MRIAAPLRRSRPRPAFTLIEVLVVISILVLLIAIIRPSLGKARETARRTVCGTQMRQHGVGMGAYANDRRWRSFDDVKLRVSVPLGAPHQRDFYF